MASKGFSKLQIALHWIVAVLIAVAWFTHEDMGRALRQRIEQDLSGMDGATLHTAAGGMAFAFILWRVIVRLRRGAPEPHGSEMVQRAAVWGHRLLYALMIAVPALGAATWFGKFKDLGDLHGFLANALMLVVLGHAAMALWHQFAKKDGTLMRMIRAE